MIDSFPQSGRPVHGGYRPPPRWAGSLGFMELSGSLPVRRTRDGNQLDGVDRHLQVLGRDVQISRCSLNVSVAHENLDCSEIRARLK